jgi:protocatechuate 3,4-dioxygenase beta subunit
MKTRNHCSSETTRRDALGIIGVAGVAVVVGCGSDDEPGAGTAGGRSGQGASGGASGSAGSTGVSGLGASGGSSGISGTGGSGGAGAAAGGNAGTGSGGVGGTTGDAGTLGSGGASGNGGSNGSDAGAGSGGAGATAGSGGASGTGGVPDAGAVTCVVRPAQTEGPYFVDEMLNRSDIRTDQRNGATSVGARFELELGIYRINGSSCVPLTGAHVDIWQCDAFGVYSDVGTAVGAKFLRGYQLTDSAGIVRFITIYPGWYTGRTVHIHLKVRTTPSSPTGFQFTSQVYFDDAFTDQVFTQAPYNTRAARATRNSNDFIYASGGSNLMLNVTSSAQVYRARFDVGLTI